MTASPTERDVSPLPRLTWYAGAAAIVTLVIVAAIEPWVWGDLYVLGQDPDRLRIGPTGSYRLAIDVMWAARVAAVVWWVRIALLGGGGISAQGEIVHTSGHLKVSSIGRGRTVPRIGVFDVALPWHWRRYVTWRYGWPRDTVTRSSYDVTGVADAAPPPRSTGRRRLVPLEMRESDEGLRLSSEAERPLGVGRLLGNRPYLRLLVLFAIVPTHRALVFGPLAAALDPTVMAPFWNSPAGWVMLVGCLTLVPAAAYVLGSHLAALRRIRRFYARTHEVTEVGTLRRVAEYLTWPLHRDSPPPTVSGLRPNSRVDLGLPEIADAVRPPTEPQTPLQVKSPTFSGPLIESLEWQDWASVAPGLAEIRVVTSTAVRTSDLRGDLSIAVVDASGLDHTNVQAASRNVPFLRSGQTVSVRISETAQIGRGVRAVVTVRTEGREETFQSPTLQILGRASFWIAPQWNVGSCAPGEVVRAGGAAEGLPSGAPVRLTVNAQALGPTADGQESSLQEVVLEQETALDEEGAFLLTWTAERAKTLHDRAAYLGWEPPTYRVQVTVLGLVGATGSLVIEG